MASIERTAFPRFPRTLTLKDLQASFSPRPEETEWAQRYARSPDGRLGLLVLLNCFHFLRYFPTVETISSEIVAHVLATLGLPPTQMIEYPAGTTAMYCHHKAVRTLLGVKPYTDTQARRAAGCLAANRNACRRWRVPMKAPTCSRSRRIGLKIHV